MATNFTKKEALKLIQGASGSTKYKLGDVQKNEIMTFYKDRSYAAAYGAGLPVTSITEGSVTYTLNAGAMTTSDKTSLGAGITSETTGFTQKTVYLSKPKQIGSGFLKSDTIMGMDNAVATKYAQALNTFDKEYERGAIKTIVNIPAKGDAIKLDPAAITDADKAKAAKQLLVQAALDMSEIVDATYALDGFDESRIFIDLSSKLFNKLVDERLIVDEAMAIFEGGIFKIGSMGGFAVRRNEFLGKSATEHDAATNGIAHAIIGTDVTAASPRQLVAANAGNIDTLSEDEGYYVEQKFASVDGTTTSYAVPGIESLVKVFVVDNA